ncbi:sushi domain-containing protein 2-like [Salvelinus alpinus]
MNGPTWCFLCSPTPQNMTVMFSSGVAVERLLGQIKSDPSDDLLTSLGEVVSPDNPSPEEIFSFGAGWNLFTYDDKYLLDTYYYVKHDPAFVPAFSVSEDAADLLVVDMLKMCFVVSCGWLATPRYREKKETHYLEGTAVSFFCNSGYVMYGSLERTCLSSGEWTGEKTYCDSGVPHDVCRRS